MMTRRGFCGTIAAAMTAGAVVVTKRWGRVTIERDRMLRAQGVHLRVFYRGQDVTRRCRFIDDTPSQQVAELFKVDAETNRAALEIVHDSIEIREGEPFA